MLNTELEGCSAPPTFGIPPDYRGTPFLASPFLSDVIRGQVLFKDETATPIKSFKGRGTFHYLSRMASPGMSFVCASAGNFGQGMAAACKQYGCSVTVFASVSANPMKVDRMRELGAKVILCGSDFDEAKRAARDYAASNNSRFVEDGAEDLITEGASSLGHEMLSVRSDFDSVLLPLGNGALICGVTRAFNLKKCKSKIIAVTAEGAPAMACSWRERQVVTAPANTIADGIAVREPVPEIMPELITAVDEVLEVSEKQLKDAIKAVFLHHGIIAEPAGVAGVAALLSYPEKFYGQIVVTALCGGNVSQELSDELFISR